MAKPDVDGTDMMVPREEQWICLDNMTATALSNIFPFPHYLLKINFK